MEQGDNQEGEKGKGIRDEEQEHTTEETLTHPTDTETSGSCHTQPAPALENWRPSRPFSGLCFHPLVRVREREKEEEIERKEDNEEATASSGQVRERRKARQQQNGINKRQRKETLTGKGQRRQVLSAPLIRQCSKTGVRHALFQRCVSFFFQG